MSAYALNKSQSGSGISADNHVLRAAEIAEERPVFHRYLKAQNGIEEKRTNP